MAASAAADAAHYAAFSLPIKIALIGVLGIGAQWLAWRLQRPAIVLMAVAGLIFGPLLGALLQLDLPEVLRTIITPFRLDPVNDFGDLYRPLVGLSVAIILFEGGLNLRFRDLGDARNAVMRMVFLGGPIAWVLGAAAAYYIVGLPLLIAIMVGGLFVVTGPTVIMPLLRQAHLKQRPANVLKWEGIVNDPVGALFAVIGYEIIVFQLTGVSAAAIFGRLAFAAIFGLVVGIASAYGLAWSFRRGHIPEYLKAPVVLAWVLAVYVLSNKLADETGLLTVTAMGMTMANLKFAAQVEMRRFKETITIILVSGVFVILTATLTPAVLKAFLLEWRVWAFVAAMMILVRPIAVMLSTLWSGLDWRESLLVALIAPRGIVAVAVAGLFAAELQALGLDQGALFVPLAFALVGVTVIFAGFFIGPLAKALGQSAGGGDGVLIVGANPWSLGLAKALRDMNIGVLIADTNWRRLRAARLDGHNTFFGEVLSENADYSLDHSQFNHLIAATPNDAYNALVSVEFAPELGRHRVFQVTNNDGNGDAEDAGIAYTSRGRTLTSRGRSFDALTRDWWSGWRFRVTKLSDEYTLEDLYRDRGDNLDLIVAKKAEGGLEFIQPGQEDRARGATVLSFCAATDQDVTRGEGAKRAGGSTLAGPTAKLPS
ncbi:sodium/hydrogen exchanger [Algimonas ampicilliniresistens]|uniref:Sodium/hydrogen exchanger n=1 Tax=Algimonas ampicilliniresistens TaxID=1298735 RepID=A0ABQ5VC04_9PROT|nr:sodium:proton antiporter [Algimonas ampicilliniresistens]GLQ24975.1 sodium/hydrogen exchanger [Algimonas ampicilliniresistens]